MGIPSETELTAAFNSLKEGNPQKAKAVLEDILSGALENEEILFAIKCAGYWCDVFGKAETVPDGYERADLLLNEWKNFGSYIRQGKIFERPLFAVKTGVCTTALKLYRNMLNEKNKALKAVILSKAGLCNKLLGNYETGIALLQEANTLSPQSADILAELADCYALSGEEKTAKVLFREAFFIDPQKVDNSFLESELFCRLAERTAEQGYGSRAVLQEWIPVYGVLYGVFNIKRELRALEAGRLKQAVFALENELKEAGDETELLVPRLINRYFWLIDHYITTNGERKRINELLLKIKLLDGSIYDMYTV